jgi:hypothetical protein
MSKVRFELLSVEIPKIDGFQANMCKPDEESKK